MKNKKINTVTRKNVKKNGLVNFEAMILVAGLIQFAFPLSGMASGLGNVSQFLVQSHIADESTVNYNLNFYQGRIMSMKNVLLDSGLSEHAKKQKLNLKLTDLRARASRQLEGLPISLVTFLNETVFSNLNEAQMCVHTNNYIRLSQILDTSAQTLQSLKTK